MKGIVREIDDVGRVTLPKHFRDQLGLNSKDPVEILLQEGCIVIKSAKQEETVDNEH